MSLGAIALTLFLLEKTRKYSLKAAMIKTVVSLFFIATCAVGLYQNGKHVLSLCVMLGLLLGLLGDIWLDLKYVYKENEKPYTYAGFVMFGIGHMLFMGGMFTEYYHGDNPLYIIIPLVAGFVVSLGNIILEKPMKLKYGKMKWIVYFYGALLFSVAFSALSLSILNNWQITPLIMILVGGVFFAISDLILSGTYFGEGKERNVDIISNALTYYIAQYLIAFAMFFI